MRLGIVAALTMGQRSVVLLSSEPGNGVSRHVEIGRQGHAASLQKLIESGEAATLEEAQHMRSS